MISNGANGINSNGISHESSINLHKHQLMAINSQQQHHIFQKHHQHPPLNPNVIINHQQQPIIVNRNHLQNHHVMSYPQLNNNTNHHPFTPYNHQNIDHNHQMVQISQSIPNLKQQPHVTRGHYIKSKKDNSDLPLPSGWEVAVDAESGKIFYVDHVNRKTQWFDPRDKLTKPLTVADCIGDELPYGWEAAFDSNIGVYYVDHIRRKNQLEDPRVEWRKMQINMLNSYMKQAESVQSSSTLGLVGASVRSPAIVVPLRATSSSTAISEPQRLQRVMKVAASTPIKPEPIYEQTRVHQVMGQTAASTPSTHASSPVAHRTSTTNILSSSPLVTSTPIASAAPFITSTPNPPQNYAVVSHVHSSQPNVNHVQIHQHQIMNSNDAMNSELQGATGGVPPPPEFSAGHSLGSSGSASSETPVASGSSILTQLNKESLEQSLTDARSRVAQLRSELEANYNLLSIIDKYYKKKDRYAVEV